MLQHLRVEENPILEMPHLEAASILLVGPTLKRFNDRGIKFLRFLALKSWLVDRSFLQRMAKLDKFTLCSYVPPNTFFLLSIVVLPMILVDIFFPVFRFTICYSGLISSIYWPIFSFSYRVISTTLAHKKTKTSHMVMLKDLDIVLRRGGCNLAFFLHLLYALTVWWRLFWLLEKRCIMPFSCVLILVVI